MKQNKIIITVILIILTFFITSEVYSQDKKNEHNFRMIFDFSIDPFFYESFYSINGLEIEGDLYFGYMINNFSVGLGIEDFYYILQNQNLSQDLRGRWNILRSSVGFFYDVHKYVELNWGVGISWFNIAFDYNEYALIRGNELGPSTFFNIGFKFPWQYIELFFINSIDVFVNSNNVYPYYQGGLRLEFHPFVKIINLYMETKGIFWMYEFQNNNIKTGLFLWNIGVAVDLTFPRITRTSKIKIEKEDNKEDNIEEEILKRNTENFNKLIEAKQDSTIVFNDIKFKSRSIKIIPESIIVIDKIAEILLENKKIVISISAYSEYLEDPTEELELIIKRGQKIKKVLTEHGIDPERIKVLEKGNVAKMIDKEKDIQDYTNVTVKIIYINN